MYGLDRFSVFVDKRPLTFNLIDPLKLSNETLSLKQAKFKKRANILSSINSINNVITASNENIDDVSNDVASISSSKAKLGENNLCSFVTRINYAIFSPEIHMQCNKPLFGRYIYIQADGRSNRWSRLFSAVLCEIQVYEN
jgi:hypothetical protein